MRNKISHRILGRDSAHRQALFRNIIEALVTHGRIRTTLAKAKEVRRFADKVVTWGKLGGSVYHSKVHAFLRTPETVKSVFEVLAPRYKDREGGYTRVLRCGFRKGDNATMAILEYVDRDGELRPAKPPRLRVEAAAAAAATSAPPPAAATLQERLAAMLQTQGAVRGAVAAGAVPSLTPAFPLPHVPARAWSDAHWAPRSRAARAAIAAGGSTSPLSSRVRLNTDARASGGSGSSSSGGDGSGRGAAAREKEPELR